MQRKSKSTEEPWLLSYADLITNLLIFFVMILSASSISKSKMQEISKKVSGKEQSDSLSAIQKKIEENIKKENLQDLVKTKLTDDGLEMSLNSGVVFDQGSAILRSEFNQAVSSMLAILVPYSQKYHFAVEGHSDPTPIVSARFPSNWELSSARALELRRQMEGLGIPRGRLRIEAYADTKPLTENMSELSDEMKLSRLRRVVVRMY